MILKSRENLKSSKRKLEIQLEKVKKFRGKTLILRKFEIEIEHFLIEKTQNKRMFQNGQVDDKTRSKEKRERERDTNARQRYVE